MSASKPRPDEDSGRLERGVPTLQTKADAIIYMRGIMKHFGIETSMLGDKEPPSLGVGLTEVTYEDIAPLVGLEPAEELRDISTFPIHRSRISTQLLKAIVMDLDAMLMQYGPIPEHKNEEATSRFFSPIFNHLFKQFSFTFRDNPEVIVSDRVGINGYVKHYLHAFGAVAILVIQVKLKVGNDTERLKAVAQVIADERDNRKRGHTLPIYCILSDGLTYEFFKFERASPDSPPAFYRGCFSGDPVRFKRGVQLPDFLFANSALPFIHRLRIASETIFDMMLSAYMASLQSHRKRAESKTKNGAKSQNLEGWDRAYELADSARDSFRKADGLLQDPHSKSRSDEIDAAINQALRDLQESTVAFPGPYRAPFVMMSWDDGDVSKM